MANIYSIYPNQNFFDEAADLLLKNNYDESNKLALSKVQVWVPSNRMAQALTDAITKKLNNFAILPQIKTISFDDSDVQTLKFYNDVDFLSDDVLSPASKLLYFAKAIAMAMPDWTFNQAFMEAPSLVKLHQDLQNYNISLEDLHNAVPFELSEHWEKNLHIVKAVFYFYDEFLKSNNKQDKYQFQNKLIELYCQQYQDKNNDSAVFAIGFNDTTTLGKKILKHIYALKNSWFVFPYINKNYFKYNLGPNNSQYAIHKLLEHLDISENDINYIGEFNDKITYIDNIFLPFEETYKWYTEQDNHSLNNFAIIEADDTLQEAKAIALAMRETLETKDKTCAMISPNRKLSQNVIKELHKWGINVNDSGGVPLSHTLKGQFALNLLEMIANDFNIDDIIPLITSKVISIDKFNFNFINSKEKFIELGVLGANVDKSLEFIEQKIKQTLPWQNKERVKEQDIAGALNIVKLLKNSMVSLNSFNDQHLSQWANSHLTNLLDYLSEDKIFDGDDGKALAEVLLELKGTDLETAIDFKTYYQTFKVLAEQTMVRQTNNLHPRLFIWGAPESRLQKIDRVILADFNDSTWPGKINGSLWLNPSIRNELNMPDISVADGLNANDVSNQLYANEVIITRSKKDDSGDTVASRFLIRLQGAFNSDSLKISNANGQYYLNILDEVKNIKTKEYLNVVNHQSILLKQTEQQIPAEISASSIKDLANCPYKFFLNKIVYLSELDDIDDIGANIWGSVVHLMLECFYNGEKLELDNISLPLKETKKEEYKARLYTIIDKILAKIGSNVIDISWRVKLHNIANEFIEISLANNNNNILVEQEFKYGNLKAICDRVEKSEDGWVIGDYKTGRVANKTDIIKFKDPQLMVESYILEHSGKPVDSLKYWHVKGYGEKAIEVINISDKFKDFDEVKADSFENIEKLLTHFKSNEAKFIPQVNGTSRKKDGVCQYCPYAGICRGFSAQ